MFLRGSSLGISRDWAPPQKAPQEELSGATLSVQYSPLSVQLCFPSWHCAGCKGNPSGARRRRTEALRRRAPKSFNTLSKQKKMVQLGFWFLICYAATQLAIQLQQERIQVVRNNKMVRRLPTESNGTPELGGENSGKFMSHVCMHCIMCV